VLPAAKSRLGRSSHRSQRVIVLTFSEQVAPAGASTLGTYRLVSAGRDRRFGTRDDRTLSLRSASYDPATLSVTLVPSGKLPKGKPLQLVVSSPALVDLALNALDGDSDGRPGGDYIGRLG
jgi:hypothetical protein